MKSRIVRDSDGLFVGIRFNCPGCAQAHETHGGTVLPVRWLPPGDGPESSTNQAKDHWSFNGDFMRPTFEPSVLTYYHLPADGYNPEIFYRCHSFVTDGCITFLLDSSHALAGTTVELPELDD